MATVVDVFQALGHGTVWVDDGIEPRSLSTQSLLPTAATEIAGAVSIYSKDASLLWAQHWDSNHALLCGRQADLLGLQIAKRLEGFYCNANTKVNWSLE